jgi:hypothetical protein
MDHELEPTPVVHADDANELAELEAAQAALPRPRFVDERGRESTAWDLLTTEQKAEMDRRAAEVEARRIATGPVRVGERVVDRQSSIRVAPPKRPHGRVRHRGTRRATVARRVRRTARAPGRSGDDDSSPHDLVGGPRLPIGGAL